MYAMQSDTGFRETVNTIFDQYIDDAFTNLGPTLGIGFQLAKIGLGIFAIMHFVGSDRADVFKALKWFPLMFILFNYPKELGYDRSESGLGPNRCGGQQCGGMELVQYGY